MQLINIGGYQINPDAIAYIATEIYSEGGSSTKQEMTKVHFIGGAELDIRMAPGIFAQSLKVALIPRV